MPHQSDAETADVIIETNSLSRRYGARWALIDVTLKIRRGEVTLLAGRNGSGKTTLLRLLATAIRPDAGRGMVDGFDVARNRDEVRRRVAMLGHQTQTYDSLSAIDNLRVAARFLGAGTSRAELMPLLAKVGLGDRADDLVATFSAGMRKRISFARFLLRTRAVVLLDEPYANLDPPGFVFVDSMLAEFRQRGASVMLATHMIERAAPLSDRGVILDGGRVRWEGAASELSVRPELGASVSRQGGG